MTITLAHHAPPATTTPARQVGLRPSRASFDIDPARALKSTWASLQERRFERLRDAFVRQGGFVPADLVSELLRPHWDQPMSRVARWIALREVVSVTWRMQVWLPLFQFERPSLDLLPAAAQVVRDLRAVYDDWELAEWFAAPHDLLAGREPAADLSHNPCAVREAARRDRFVSRW